MSSEQLAGRLSQEGVRDERTRPLNEALLTRRRFFRKIAAGMGVAAMGATGAKRLVIPRVIEEYSKYSSIGGDYSNLSFFQATGARVIDRARLNELRMDDTDEITVALYGATKEAQTNPGALAEYDMILDRDGPVFAEFDGLYGDSVSLAVIRAVVDGSEEFLVPLVRDRASQPPVTIQLGRLPGGSHKLELFEEYAAAPVAVDEIAPRVSQGSTGTLRSFLDLHQPDIYLRDYGNIANNFPRRSYVAVLETDSEIAAVYITECFDEDQVYGLFGTSVQQLIETKNRPTDIDWGIEMLIDKENGSIRKANIAAPYHSRKELPVDQEDQTGRLSVRVASANNNLKILTDPSTLALPKVRLRPVVVTYDEMRTAVRKTDPSTARLSLCENYKEGKIDPHKQTDAAILDRFGLNVDDCAS